MTASAKRQDDRAPRSVAARHPRDGAPWPGEMRADMAAAFLDYETTGKLFAAVLRGEAPRPTATRLRAGRREPVWSLDGLRAFVAVRHGTSPGTGGAAPALPPESIGRLL